MPSRSPIHYAASVDVLQLLIDNGADISLRDENGRQPLHNSVISNSLKMVKLLIDNGACINETCDFLSMSPLHYAAQKGYVNIVKYLLKNGADPSQKELMERTPTEFARYHKHYDVIDAIQHFMATKIISEKLSKFDLSDDEHSYMTERIYNACNHYAHKYTLSNESTLTHILYLKIDYVIKKLTPSIIKKIMNESDPLRIKTLLMNELYTYDKELQDEREAIINKEQTCMVEDKWESARQCPRCRQRKYKVRQVITRCIDEGTTMKADCVCGNTFML